MEFDNKTIALPNDHSSENQLDLRNIIEKYLIHWKWFILSASIFIAIGFYTLNFKRQVFQASTTIKIKNEQQGDRSALSVFQDLGVMAPASQNVEDEMEILMSRDLIAEVIKSLKLNVQIFTDKNYLSTFLDKNLSFNTHFYENENYTNPPITINFILNDSILEKTRASFVISINSTNNFTFINLDESFDKSSGNRYAFGKKIETNFGDIIITPNPAIESKELIGLDALIRITPLRELANTYADRIEIEPKSDYSSVLSLKISDGTKVKAESFLEELVNKYNERAIRLKDELTKSTSNFVTRRLEIISNELSDVDLTAESIKTRYQISDAASETGLNMQSGQAVENQIVQANTQLEKIGYIKEFVATKDENDLIPIDVGVADNNVSSTMQQYNELMMQKKRLLENSTEKNPIVVNLNEQLKTLKFNIDQGLNNLESSQKISLDALNRQDLRINSRLYSAPRQERQYRDVQRQQQIKEALYLYLLQKREETAITLGVADPNAKIIDSPESLKNPISPKKTRTLFGFIILGIVFPIGVIYLVDLLDTKIQTKEDVERVLNIPIIGDIPKFESNKNYLIKKDDYSSVAEAFRILRTNLNFILPKSLDSKGKFIFITSTIAHEGKSHIASNLAASLCHAGKRTLLMGMDIRAPKLKGYLGAVGTVGITNYIIDSELNPKDIVVKSTAVDNLDIILSGDIAPNPSELLMNPRVSELFDYSKNNYDYIIVDTAAYSMVTDTLIISNFADTFIYVIRANYLDKRYLKYIKHLHSDKRLNNMNLLINGIDFKKSYGYGYGYGYGTKFEKSKKKKWFNILS